MKEAIGGIFSIGTIVFLILVINGYLAFSVNYTKAFRVKNEIRSIIQKNEGLTDNALEQIEEYMHTVKYVTKSGFTKWCENNGYKVAGTGDYSFCYKVNQVDQYGTTNENSKYKGAYYTVATFVNMNIPLLNNLLPFTGGFFRVEGETALIYSSGNNSEVSGTS